MSDTTFVPGIAAPPIPLREVLPWAIFAALALLAIYLVGAEEGATSLINGIYVHEFLHDGRQTLVARQTPFIPLLGVRDCRGGIECAGR
jgi:hypothetical protein